MYAAILHTLKVKNMKHVHVVTNTYVFDVAVIVECVKKRFALLAKNNMKYCGLIGSENVATNLF